MKTIEINADNVELNTQLERIYNDVSARQSVITFMLNSESFNNVNSETFKKYHDEYVEKYIEYDKIRNKVGEYYGLNKYGNNAYWSINFQTQTITVSIND